MLLTISEFFRSICNPGWFQDHLLYLSGLGGIIILVFLVLIIIRISKDIKIISRRQRNSAINNVRKYTKMEEDAEKGPPKLKF